MCRSGWGVSSPIKWQSKKARTLFTMARLQKKYMEKVGWPRKLFWNFRGILELQSGTILATWLRLSKISGLCGITVADIINTVETGVCPNLEKVTQTRIRYQITFVKPSSLCLWHWRMTVFCRNACMVEHRTPMKASIRLSGSDARKLSLSAENNCALQWLMLQ